MLSYSLKLLKSLTIHTVSYRWNCRVTIFYNVANNATNKFTHSLWQNNIVFIPVLIRDSQSLQKMKWTKITNILGSGKPKVTIFWNLDSTTIIISLHKWEGDRVQSPIFIYEQWVHVCVKRKNCCAYTYRQTRDQSNEKKLRDAHSLRSRSQLER